MIDRRPNASFRRVAFALTLAAACLIHSSETTSAMRAPFARTLQRLALGQPLTIASFGDSISELNPGTWHGGASAPERMWAALLGERVRAARPGATVTIIHLGIGGQNCYEGLARFSALAAAKPDLVLVEFGTNDCCHHFLQPEESARALNELLERIAVDLDADAVVIGMGGDNPKQPFFAHFAETARALQAVALRRNMPYADVRAAMLTATGDGERWAESNLSADNCHPNDRGHTIWAASVERVMDAVLKP